MKAMAMWVCLYLCWTSRIKVFAQSDTASSVVLTGPNTLPSSLPDFGGDLIPTGSDVSYLSYSTASPVNRSMTNVATSFAEVNSTSLSPSSSHNSRSSSTISILRGTAGSHPSITSSLNGTDSINVTASGTTSTSAVPTNIQPCNNYPEYCTRRYSNITYIAAHNSPFVNANNAAANQLLSVTDQLNDGVRMLQGQTHYNRTTSTIYYCHSSCDLLNAGTAESYFRTVARWVRKHPFDIVTILIGNSDFVDVRNYTAPLTRSGLSRYAYIPHKVPMNVSAWPRLEEMILMQKRVVIFIDYKANQTQVPYIIDQFSQVWETPFSPQNRSFPCTQQRPPDLGREGAEGRMYVANHNLNTEVALAGTSLLVPTTVLINETNAVEGFGSLGVMADDCTGKVYPIYEPRDIDHVLALWNRPPNFLLVDFYNRGNFPGSVFEVAARHNNVTYNRPCCGVVPSAAVRCDSEMLLVLALYALVFGLTL